MKLSLAERIQAVLSFPTKKAPIKALVFDELKSLLSFTPSEREEFEIVDKINEDGSYSVSWNEKGATYVKDFDLSSEYRTHLKEHFDEMGDEFPVMLVEFYKGL